METTITKKNDDPTLESVTDCLHRLLNCCPNCTKDLDINHHPNNLDCPKYYKINLTIYEVKE